MKKLEIIEKAMAEGRTTLTEAESKDIVKQYGIPVVKEISVKTQNELEDAAQSTGYPLVLKGLGSHITHKTEKGLVKLNLKNKEELHSAASYIEEAAGDDLEGYLIQPMLEGKREFVAGLFYDEQFGPAIMFGLGGVFTEAIGDVVFRLALSMEKKQN